MRTVPISCIWPTLSPVHMLAGTTSAQLTFPSPHAAPAGLMLPNVADILSTEPPAMGQDMCGGVETHVRRMQKTVGPSSQRTELAGDGLALAVLPLLVKSLGTKMNDHICSKHPTDLGMFLDKG